MLFAPVLCSTALLAAGCGVLDDDDGGDASRFCGEIAANAQQLTQPELRFDDDVAPLLALYREIGRFAPLAIEPEWQQLVDAYETAAAVVPGDEESEQRALAAIYSAESSAAAVDRWLDENCAVDIGPVTTIVPHDP